MVDTNSNVHKCQWWLDEEYAHGICKWYGRGENERYCKYFETEENLEDLKHPDPYRRLPTGYPYCDLQGTGKSCNKYEETSVLADGHCTLPSNVQLNRQLGRTWAYMKTPAKFDRNGVLVTPEDGASPMFDYNDITFFGELNTTNEAKCKCEGCDTNRNKDGGYAIDCSGYSPGHISFTELDPEIEKQYNFSIEHNGVRYYYPTGWSFGVRLPLEFKIMNVRSTLGRCYWWDGKAGNFEAYFEPTDEIPITPDEAYMLETGIPRIWFEDTGTLETKCKCTEAKTDIHKEFRFDEELGTYVAPCNGAKPECPCYTSAICWQYCIDEKLQPGDKVLAEQIMELRYYMKKDRWTKDSYEGSFNSPDIFAWDGPGKMQYKMKPAPGGVGFVFDGPYHIGVRKIWFDDFKGFNIKSKTMSLTNGTEADKIPIFPTLVEEIGSIDTLGISPVIRNVFDKDVDGKNIFEATDMFHKNILMFGEMFYYNSSTFCINLDDPYFKDMFNKFPELRKQNTMLEIKVSKHREINDVNNKNKKIEEFEDFHNRLSFTLDNVLLHASDKVGLSTYGEKNNYFWIEAPTVWGKNTLLIFNKSDAGYWMYDKIEVMKVFQGGIIAQKSFIVEGDHSTETVDYLPLYESNFMTSENNNDSKITFEFIPFITKYGTCEADHVYNDTVLPSQMCSGIGVDSRNNSTIYNNEWWGDNRVRHAMPYNTFEYNMAYYGDPDGSIYSPKIKTEEIIEDTGKHVYEATPGGAKWFDYEACYKVFKIPIFSGELTSTVPEDVDSQTGDGAIIFFGNAGMCVVTIPEVAEEDGQDPDKLSAAFPWGIKDYDADDVKFVNEDIEITLTMSNPEYDPNAAQNEETIDTKFKILEKDPKKLNTSQIILMPDPEEEFTSLNLCDATANVDVYSLEKRSFGETVEVATPDGEATEVAETIGDDLITGGDSSILVNYRSIDTKDKAYIDANGVADYSVPGLGTNLTGAVTMERDGVSNNFVISNFDVDPLMVSVAFKSKVTGRILGVTRTKMITWVRQPYARDVFISYKWQADYDLKTWTSTNTEPEITGHKPYKWGTYPCATSYFYPYTGFYAVQNVGVTPMNNRLPFTSGGMRNPTPSVYTGENESEINIVGGGTVRTGGFLDWGCIQAGEGGGAFTGASSNSVYDPFQDGGWTKQSIEVPLLSDNTDLLYSRPHERHELFSPEAFTSPGYSDVGGYAYGRHGFYDARMMGPPEHMVVTCSQIEAYTRYWKIYDPVFWWRYEQPPYPYMSGCRMGLAQGDRIGDPEFIGRGIFMGGVSEADKRQYFGYSEEPPIYVSTGGNPDKFLNLQSCDLSQVHVFSGVLFDQKIWYPWYMMQPLTLKFGNTCREVLTSFLSVDNMYYGKMGRIQAVAYPEVKDRRDRISDPRPLKTGMLNENSEWALREAWPEIHRPTLNSMGTVKTPTKRSDFLPIDSSQEDVIYVGTDIPDYYYRKWLPVNFYFTHSNITRSYGDEDGLFRINTSDAIPSYVNPMGMYLISSREGVEMNEHILKESDIPKRLRFVEVFRADKLDLETYKKEDLEATSTSSNQYYKGPEGITHDKIGLVYPSSYLPSVDADGELGSEERSIFWYVYNEIPDDIAELGFTDDEKPEDWAEGANLKEPITTDQIHWAWQEIWSAVERQAIDINTFNYDEAQVKEDPTDAVEAVEPFQLTESEGANAGLFGNTIVTGKLSFIGNVRQPSYGYDYDLYENRLVCSEEAFEYEETPPTDVGIEEPNHVLRFIPPPIDEETGKYKYFLYFLQLDDGPPRAFDDTGEWDPKEKLLSEEYPVEIYGWTGEELYNIYTLSSDSENEWYEEECSKCGGTGKDYINDCTDCDGTGTRRSVNLFEKIEEDPVSADDYDKLYIDQPTYDESGSITGKKLFFRRGLFVEFNPAAEDVFSLFPKKQTLMPPDDLETTFVYKVPVSVKDGSLNPDEGAVDSDSPYTLKTRNINANYKLTVSGSGDAGVAAKLGVVDIAWGEQKRNVNKVVLRFTVGSHKTGDETQLYHLPSVEIFDDLNIIGGFPRYPTSDVKIYSPPDKISSEYIVAEWDLDRNAMTDPRTGLSISIGTLITEQQLDSNKIIKKMTDEAKANLVHRVRLEAIFIYICEVAEAVEFIKTHERKYNVSVGSCGDIYPNRLAPNNEEKDELREINPNGSFSNYPSRQSQRSELSTVYETDIPAGIVGHRNDFSYNTAEPIKYASKCRGRSVGYTAENATQLLINEGGSEPASSDNALLDSWERLQQKNFDKILEDGNTSFTMQSVCPPGLLDHMKEVGIYEFPKWNLNMRNDFVSKLTPTVQFDPFGSPGPQAVFAGDTNEGWCNEYTETFVPRNRWLELGRSNTGCNVHYYADNQVFMGEDKTLLQAQKEYFYNTIYPFNNIKESKLNYPYPPDCFHTMTRGYGDKWGTMDYTATVKASRYKLSSSRLYPSQMSNLSPYPKETGNDGLGKGGLWTREVKTVRKKPDVYSCPPCLDIDPEYGRCGYTGLFAQCEDDGSGGVDYNIYADGWVPGAVIQNPICIDHPDLCKKECWFWSADIPDDYFKPYLIGDEVC